MKRSHFGYVERFGVGVTGIKIFGDSKLVLLQLQGIYNYKVVNLIPLMEQAKSLMARFVSCQLMQVPQECNQVADALASAVLQLEPMVNMIYVPRQPIQELGNVLHAVSSEVVCVVQIEDPLSLYEKVGWVIAFNKYPAGCSLEEKKKLLRFSQPFSMVPVLYEQGQAVSWDLYRQGCDKVWRKCVFGQQIQELLFEAHDQICGGHFDVRLTAGRILRAGFYWPTLHKDVQRYCAECVKCQQYARVPRALGHMFPIKPGVVFAKWGIDTYGRSDSANNSSRESVHYHSHRVCYSLGRRSSGASYFRGRGWKVYVHGNH